MRPVAEKVKLPALHAPAPETKVLARQDSKTYGGLEKEGSTLRRPIAIRPREFNKARFTCPSELDCILSASIPSKLYKADRHARNGVAKGSLRGFSAMQDSGYAPATPSEGSLEALLSRMHPSATSAASPTFSSLQSMSHQPPPAPATACVNASDLGRVMQWAGTELSLRDQKVNFVIDSKPCISL